MIRYHNFQKLHVLFFMGLMLCYSGILSAAAPVTHAYLSERFFTYFSDYTEEEKRSFMLGTLFPDIQYLGEVSRHDTHWQHMSLEEVLEEPMPFMAGVKFHSYVDCVREEFVIDYQMYDKLAELVEHPQLQTLYLMLKLMEDEIVFEKQSWQEWFDSFQEIHEGELGRGISIPTIRKWHNLINVSLSNRPSAIIFLLNVANQGFLNISADEIAYWHKIYRSLVNSEVVQNYVEAMLEHFEEQFRREADAIEG